jgi:hypothetical protein
MTSFPVEIEPRPEPRLAVAVLLLHAVAAAMPWATRCPGWLAALLSLSAAAALAATIRRLAGRHCRLQGLVWRADGWRVRLAAETSEWAASVGPGTRVHADLVALDLRSARGRMGWLLTREALDPGQFRRLKVRLRLTC